eukprot:TRINITY_DN12724_c0_g1_i1.p1 TRINITY_DN12724_c0_g1~~TRINITY_DN12724_c0_g1_i1.p1  ORF type:complete len:338 (-),score=98.02 TRINITY_DN12724_c0_g1_i1:55-1068(-)
MEQVKDDAFGLAEELKSQWTQEQDLKLQDLVETYGTKDWLKVSESLNATFSQTIKSVQQCYCRWEELVEESAKRAWTEEDELSMIVAHKKYKNRWADISESLKGRSNNTIKNKFYSVFRKIRGKIAKSDCTYSSKLELLEIHYIISLVEHYLAHPILVPKLKGKRGKDFIYSLIDNLNEKMVADYKKKIQAIASSQGTMEELFAELSAGLKSTQSDPPKNAQVKQRIKTAPSVHSVRALRRAKISCEPIDDKLSPFQREPGADNSPLFNGHLTPPLLFSPGTLSAGPAAAAASAARAPCFNNGFSEFSGMAKSYGEMAEGYSHKQAVDDVISKAVPM